MLIVNLSFSGLAAIAALVGSFFSGDSSGVSGLALALGGGAWFFLAAFYLVAFWSLAAQTPGMRFFGIGLGVEGRGLPLRRSLKRLVGLGLSVLALGIGFLGILFGERRRGWQDRLAGVDVLYEIREREPAPWSRLDLGEPVAGDEAGIVRGLEGRGRRPQGASRSPLHS
jgi:uncharacterized RDD family membrane protein YckC